MLDIEMDDYSALAQRIAVSIREISGCLILSRDGMVLGTYPDEEESAVMPAWLRFCALGEPERSFVEFADQTWAFVKRGPYAAFAVAEAGVRPGIMVDQLEQILLTAEDGRSKRDTMRVPDAASAHSGKPRTSLHPSSKPEPAEDGRSKWSRSIPQIAGSTPGASSPAPSATKGTSAAGSGGKPAKADPKPAEAAAPGAPVGTPVDAGSPKPAKAAAAAPKAPEGPVTALRRTPQKLVTPEPPPSEEDAEVDPVMLAREFSRLLQMNSDDDEGSS